MGILAKLKSSYLVDVAVMFGERTANRLDVGSTARALILENGAFGVEPSLLVPLAVMVTAERYQAIRLSGRKVGRLVGRSCTESTVQYCNLGQDRTGQGRAGQQTGPQAGAQSTLRALWIAGVAFEPLVQHSSYRTELGNWTTK